MNLKKRIFILFLLIFLLSIAAVSASDANDTNVLTSVDTSDGDIISASDEYLTGNNTLNNGIADEENSLNLDNDENGLVSASFSDLQMYIDAAPVGSEIEIYNDYSLADGGSTINITKSITIDGHNHIIDGYNKETILNIGPGAEYVVLKNIEFKNGKKGGAILSSTPSLTLINCKFTSNNADHNGGAVNSVGALAIIDCTFQDNKANQDGGAICNHGTLTINNGRFENNKANQDGGAIFNNGTLTMNKNTFFGSNNANHNGGAVNNIGALFIIDSSFRENNAHQNGGAICNNGKITIINSGFVLNTVKDATKHAVGGAIANWGDCYINSSSNFISNYADNEAGAIYCVGNLFCDASIFQDNGVNYGNGPIAGVIECFGDVHASNSQFIRNYAGHNPIRKDDACMSRYGTIYARGKCYIDSCNFDTNFAVKYGGAIYSCDDLYINGKCSFKNHIKAGTIWAEKDVYINWNTNETDVLCEISGGTIGGDGGAAIHTQGSLYAKHLKVHNCNCVDSTVYGGGAIYSHGRTTIYNSEFSTNTVHINRKGYPHMETGNGGAISSRGSCYIESCNFFNNIGEKGAAIYAKGDLTITGQSIFGANSQYLDLYPAEGGAILCEGNLLVENARFTDNHAIGAGGAIYCIGTCTVRNSEFYRNNATTEVWWDQIMMAKRGGAICSRGTVDIDHCIFTDNGADAGGGAIWAYNEIKVRNSNFTDNVVSGKFIGKLTTEACGGAIFIYNKCSPEIVSCIFDGNECRFNGGAIHVRLDSHLTLSDCNLYYNTANNEGGAIYCSGQTTISNSEFYQNQALTLTAGAIRSLDSITINGCVFQDNSAETSAGAIYADKQISIKNSNFTGNGANEVGAIYASTVTQVSNSQFYGNKAYSGNGGAIHITGECNPEFISCLFEQNSCPGYGGAIYPDSSSTSIKLSGCEFNNNHANRDGGAVYGKAPVTVVDSKFTFNSAGSSGGAVYANTKIIIKNSNFTSNSANKGGAVYTDTIDQTVSNSVFIKNKATENDGGAIYLGSKSSYLDLDSCTFIDNTGKQGGAVYAHQITKVSNSKFYGNKATSDSGGALHVQNDDPGNWKIHSDISSCIFENNNASNLGGAVYYRSWYAHLTISDSEFYYNNARQGGAVYVDCLTKVSKSVFIGNKATGKDHPDGGAIYVFYNCDPELVSCRFEGNTADNIGGVAYLYGITHLKISYCTFVDNHAYRSKHPGHIIYTNGEFDLVDMCWFGTNNPNFRDQFVKYHTSSENEYIPKNYLKLGIKINETNYYIGDPYKVTVYLYSTNGANINGQLLHSNWRISLQNADLISNETTDNHLNAYVIFTKDNALITGKLDYQEESLKINAKIKSTSEVRILACDDVNFPLQLSATYEIINKTDNAIYQIKNSKGETVIQGNLKESKGYMRITYEGIGTPLEPGQYSLTIINQESRTTFASSANATYNILKNDITMRIFVPNKTYGEDVECTVNVDTWFGIRCNLTVTNDSGAVVVSRVVDITQRVAHFNLGVMHAGNYSAKISYAGNDRFNPVSNSTRFEVKRAGTPFKIELNSTSIAYGETVTATPILPAGATGTITYYLDNGTYLGKLAYNENLTLPVLDTGAYVIIANYSGDEDDEPAIDTEFLLVNPALNNVIVNVADVTYGNASVINILADADGVYQLDVNGSVYNITVNNGIGNKSLTLNAGTYYANVTFDDENYNTNAKNATFRVNKADIDLMVYVFDEVYPQDVEATVYASIDGLYNLTVGKRQTVVTVKNNIGYFNAGVIDAGTYEAVVSFAGNDNYNSAWNMSIFVVNTTGTLFEIETEPSEITYGETANVINILPNGATGKITYYFINGTFIAELPFNETLTLPVLNAGNYIIIANYSGDGNFNPANDIAFLEVNPLATNLSVVAYSTVYPQEVVGTVYASLDGEYNLTIGEYSTIVTVKKGYAEFNAGILDAGDYMVVVTYPGDLNHMANSSSTKITVSQFIPEITMNVSDINYGDVGVITITSDIPGSVNVTVNGVTETLDLNGQKKNILAATSSNILRAGYGATLNVYNLNGGTYPVTVVYNGNGNIESVELNDEFRVNALNITMEIDSININVGDDEIITATLPSNVTGNVTVTVDGQNYTAPVKDGKAIITIPGLTAGSKSAEVSYSGDENYNPVTGNTSFEVKKIKPEISIDTNSPTSGEVAHIVVNLPNDATGTVTINVDGKTYTAEVKDGKAVFDIPGLNAGKYNITAYYSGDDKYYPTQTDVILTVNSTKHENHSNEISHSENMPVVGNPILILLLALITTVPTSIRRFKK